MTDLPKGWTQATADLVQSMIDSNQFGDEQILDAIKHRGASARDILKYRRDRGIPHLPDRLFAIKRDRVMSLYNAGKEQFEIVKETGYSTGTVSKIVRRYRPQSRKPAATARVDADIRAIWSRSRENDDWSISAALCLTQEYVAKRREAMGLAEKLPPGKRPKEMPKGADPALWATGGKWALLADYAKKKGLTTAQAQAAWHRVRA